LDEVQKCPENPLSSITVEEASKVARKASCVNLVWAAVTLAGVGPLLESYMTKTGDAALDASMKAKAMKYMEESTRRYISCGLEYLEV
jgi:hypothetical protein